MDEFDSARDELNWNTVIQATNLKSCKSLMNNSGILKFSLYLKKNIKKKIKGFICNLI